MKCTLVFIIFFLITTASFGSENEIILTPDRQYQLAKSLMDNNEHLAAANEFIRFAYLFPEHKNISEAQFNTGLSFFKAKRLKEAFHYLSQVAFNPSHGEFSNAAIFKLSELYLIDGKFGEAVLVLRNMIMLSKDTLVNDKAYYVLGWLMLDYGAEIQADSDYPVDPIKESRKYFSQISIDGKHKYGAEWIINSLGGIGEVKTKDPTIAGILSIVPGAGFLYCERYRDAFVSFLLNTTLALAAFRSFQNGNPYLGGAIVFFESGFYTGNIYGAVAGAHKYNSRQKKEYIKKIKQKARIFPTLSYKGPLKMGLALMFEYQF